MFDFRKIPQGKKTVPLWYPNIPTRNFSLETQGAGRILELYHFFYQHDCRACQRQHGGSRARGHQQLVGPADCAIHRRRRLLRCPGRAGQDIANLRTYTYVCVCVCVHVGLYQPNLLVVSVSPGFARCVHSQTCRAGF